ncbi:hypothetical protein BDV25DRAFT_162585 [Aspergillus avenaceus]|uniref:Uncharacterized protein n=1 Tax=Aspergillus avenaceus TaxID=36643 RepID=A0A5N6TJ54_ASPAV|nr:hypothetical protein BDV25DRAFT_162585 [Aspergillus avenaceus]
MTYKPPKVEEDASDASEPQKRKREEKYPELEPTSEQEFETEKQQPPSKASKADETPGEDDEVDEDEFEGEDEGLGDEDEGADEEEEEFEVDDDEGVGGEEDDEVEEEEQGQDDDEEEDEEEDGDAKDGPKVQKAIDKLGRTPLDGTSIGMDPLTATPNTLLAMVIDAMLKSRPISHDLSQRAVNKVIEVGYHDIQKLGDSSWDERTMVLKDGGYNRYREQGATDLGELAHLIGDKYDGDLNNLLEKAHHDRESVRKLIKEVRGLGDLGVELFLNNVQSVWPDMAPFVDGRSLKTADEVGIGTDMDAIFEELKRDSMKMSRLANGLSTARLEKRQGDLLSV